MKKRSVLLSIHVPRKPKEAKPASAVTDVVCVGVVLGMGMGLLQSWHSRPQQQGVRTGVDGDFIC